MIKTLRTAYPYAVTDKIVDETTTSEDKLIGSKFSPLKCKYPHTRENKHVKINVISSKKFLAKLKAQLIYNLVNCMNFKRRWTASLNKKLLKDIAYVTNDETLRLPFQFKYMQWYIATLDNIKSKL